MQGFINEEYYVFCARREEVLAFYELCKEYALKFTPRWHAEKEIIDFIENATFVYNYHEANPGDGVSFWTNQPNGDRGRPLKRFDEIIHNAVDAPDILSLL